MTTTSPLNDASSLLVPVTLDAWVVDSQNQEAVSWYYANFSNLAAFQSPIPGAFDTSNASKPTVGVHLHWALPDALTHGGESDDGGQFAFPFVPNRWLVARFNVPVIGTTAAALSGGGVTAFALQAGCAEPIAAGMPLQLVSPDGTNAVVVTVSSAVAQGGQQVQIQSADFNTAMPAGSTVRRLRANDSLTPPNGPWQCKLWVVRSDYLNTADTPTGLIGTTAADLSGSGVTSISLQGGGADAALAAGVALEVVTPGGQYSATVTTAAAVAQGATQIAVEAASFTNDFPAGSTVQLQGSAFLDPTQPTYMQAPGSVGATAADLSGSGVTTVQLASPGAAFAIAAGTSLRVATEQYQMTFVTAAAVNAGDTQITIQPQSFGVDFPAGSPVFQLTTFEINYATIGGTYDIAAWEALNDPAAGQLYLQAVGPANVSFAAYAPFVKSVFNFTDNDLPPEGTGVYPYTYMVVGWYSDALTADPLRGVTTYPQGEAAYVPAIWDSEDDWNAQTEAERFQAILARMLWSVEGDVPDAPPSTSLYHGLVSGVQWPYSTLGNAGIDSSSISVAVGNTSVDALAALIQAEAQAEAQQDPGDSAAWIAAGDTLSGLIEAAMYDLMDVYGTPGGAVLLEQQVEQAWYGSYPGGTIWDVVSDVPQTSGQTATQPALTAAQAAALASQLAALNQSQQTFDAALRQLESLQASLYMMWLKYAMSNLTYGWGQAPITTPSWSVLSYLIGTQFYPSLFNQVWDQYCVVSGQQLNLPDPTDDGAANQWANTQWSFPAASGGTVTLADLGLKLKAGTMPRFWHPNDPVLMIAGLDRAQKHGEDGRYNADGTLTCRLPGQLITGVNIQGQPSINVQTLTNGGVNLAPCGSPASVPGIPNLTQEAFLFDPGNAAVMAVAVGGDATAIEQGISGLLDETDSCGTTQQDANPNSWQGQPPPPFAVAVWEQAWAPLFLEWQVQYFPTGASGKYSQADWHFDGEGYTWNGGALDTSNAVGYTGRTLLTPQSPLLFKDKIQDYLAHHSSVDTQQMESLIATVACWDILSQSLSGLYDQFLTMVVQEAFPPPPGDASAVPCPRSAGGATPDVTTLVGDQYHNMPVLQSPNPEAFFPVRGGFVQFQQLQVVDAFGQTFGGPVSNPLSGWPLTQQGFQPLFGQGLAPAVTAGDSVPNGFPYGAFQLSPCLIQSARLDLSFLANDGSGQDVNVSADPNAVCGWLLPNHLDGSISVYDEDGILLGELWPLPQPDNWRPSPGPPGNNPPPAQPSDIKNAVLRAVVSSIAAQSVGTFEALLGVIDETLWMVDPLGGRKDQFLSVLIGRPLAVVQARVGLSLLGNPAYNQTWDKMALSNSSPPPDYVWQQDTGGVEAVSFPVRLGSLELRDDGVIGYYLPDADDYATFYAVHTTEEGAGVSYIRQIVQPATSGTAPQFQGDISLQFDGASVTATLILDPRGSVHAYTGILPVTTAALAADLVENFISQLRVTFRTGPIIADPGTLRTPKPAEDKGVWSWLQAVPAPVVWEVDQIVDADDVARLADAQLQLREGWLQLSDIDDSGD